MDDLSEDDLVEAIKLHFQLMAEAIAALAAKNPPKSMAKMNVTCRGFEVSAAIMAKEAAQ